MGRSTRRAATATLATIGTCGVLLALADPSCTETITGQGASAQPEGGSVVDAGGGCIGEACHIGASCNASCDCAATGQACVRGSCQTAAATGCQSSTDCPCDQYCADFANGTGRCVRRCHANADCVSPDAFCYLPMGRCGPCINDPQCGEGNHCLGGVCTPGEGGAPSPPSCENSSQCTPSAPVCQGAPGSVGSCAPCYTAPEQCGDGGGGSGGEGTLCPFCQGCNSGLTCTCAAGDTCSIFSSCYGTAGGR